MLEEYGAIAGFVAGAVGYFVGRLSNEPTISARTAFTGRSAWRVLADHGLKARYYMPWHDVRDEELRDTLNGLKSYIITRSDGSIFGAMTDDIDETGKPRIIDMAEYKRQRSHLNVVGDGK